MKNTITLNLRTYPVGIEDARNPGQVREDTLVLAKAQIQACQLVGQSATELIHRIYNRQGFRVHEIGKPDKQTVAVELGALEWMTAQYEQHMEERAKEAWLEEHPVSRSREAET